MIAEGDYIAIFNSIHRVLKAEKILKGLGMPILLIPAPRAISSDCGLAIRYGDDVRERVEAVLRREGLMPEDIFRKSGDSYLKADNDDLKGMENR